ncbi:unnamed protein product [Adineta ricciae]|uniref:Major facilitator superfamily (MFS) profile domain-containing protein n=1 Tax=Adineta ricciae TaxID=249248 RepID=A0A814QS86_ADIRI|nr:unnamed protein product [Adineta ricciae]CAF1188673.1 unnamed protein product [Adineta ricciae]
MTTEKKDSSSTPASPHTSHISVEVVDPTIKQGDSQKILERKLKRKLDILILPLTTFLYLCAHLDRGNMGNVKLQGLKSDIMDDSDTKYSIALTCFYIAYITFNVPGNIMAKILQPSIAIGIAALIWGVASSLQAAVFNFAGIVVCRIFIGIGEACFGPVVPLYYSIWYKRDEIALRNALFIGCGALAGAFGGLIAYGVSFAKGSSIGASWRILFLVEGLPTIALSVLIFFFLPSRPETSKYLTEEEREIAVARLAADQHNQSHKKKFQWSGFRRAVTDYRSYTYGVIYLGVNLTLSSISGFLPTIIVSLGHTDAEAQLYSVPPYACAAVYMIIICRLSDRLRCHGLFVAGTMLLSCVGWIILLTVTTNQHARYFATFIVVMGAFTAVPLMLSWISKNTPNESQRAVQLGILNAIGQCFSILAAFIFPTSDRPYWKLGFGLNLAFNGLSAILAAILYCLLRYENARRDRLAESNNAETTDPSTTVTTDLAPTFRYIP